MRRVHLALAGIGVSATLLVAGPAAAAGSDATPLAAVAGLATAAASAPALSTSVTASLVSDAAWILTAQLPDGAIASYVDQHGIQPYLANMAASGLARATAVTGDRRYAQAGWHWLAWYQAHEGAQGFVTDYRLSNGAMVSTGDMDSTDAYAGTFLSAAGATWAALPDPARLLALHAGVSGAVAAIEATQDTDGLTWAKPAWHVKYLMDQAETYAGLTAAVVLANALGDEVLAARATVDAARLHAGVNGMWDPAEGAYDWAIHGDGARQHTNWSKLYPDAMEQAWAVSYGLASPAAATAILTHLTTTHPEWDHPQTPANIDGTTRNAGYWAVAGFGFARSGNLAVARSAGLSIQSDADATHRAWPFTTGDAGNLIVLFAQSAPARRAGAGPTASATATPAATTTAAAAPTTAANATTTPTTAAVARLGASALTDPAGPTSKTPVVRVTARRRNPIAAVGHAVAGFFGALVDLL